MNETPEQWAREQFGPCRLGDRRRTARAVQLGAALARSPGKSIPQQMQSAAATKAAYRFLNQAGISYQALIGPHWAATREQLRQAGTVLLIQDLTEIDYTAYWRSIQGLGPIGDGRGLGYLMSTVLGVRPAPRQVLGIAYQEPYLRQPEPGPETRAQRARRAKESDVWMRAVSAIGDCPAGQTWVHVGDRGSDIYAFLETCRQHHCHFLIRACQNRKIQTPEGVLNYLLTFARQLPAQAECHLHLPAGHGRKARDVQARLAFSPVTLTPNWLNRKRTPVQAWVVRVWEADPDPAVAEPLDWYLLTSVPTETVAQGWERVDWYRARWLVEDFHQCLKTGCQLEQRRLQHRDDLLRLLGLLAPVAVRLLALREQSRLEPDRLAHTWVPPDLLRLVAHLAQRDPQQLTLQAFWHLVAQQGGYLGRKRDGPPGWKSLWQGWLYLQNLLRGVHLANELDL